MLRDALCKVTHGQFECSLCLLYVALEFNLPDTSTVGSGLYRCLSAAVHETSASGWVASELRFFQVEQNPAAQTPVLGAPFH